MHKLSSYPLCNSRQRASTLETEAMLHTKSGLQSFSPSGFREKYSSGTQEQEVTLWWLVWSEAAELVLTWLCLYQPLHKCSTGLRLDLLMSNRGRAHALPLPSRSPSTNSCENGRNKFEASAPPSRLTEICLWLRNLPGMSE